MSEHHKNPHLEEAHQHLKAARQAMRQSVESMLPPGFVESRRKARKEFLLAVRSMLDAAIERFEKTTKSS